jgi:hypothetical protein
VSFLLEFDDECHLFSFAAVRAWAGRYGVSVGWNVGACGDSRADARIFLYGTDGGSAWGGSCPLRAPPPPV